MRCGPVFFSRGCLRVCVVNWFLEMQKYVLRLRQKSRGPASLEEHVKGLAKAVKKKWCNGAEYASHSTQCSLKKLAIVQKNIIRDKR